MDLQVPKLFERYYKDFYQLTGITTGKQPKAEELRRAIDRLDFEAMARLYTLIDKESITSLSLGTLQLFKS